MVGKLSLTIVEILHVDDFNIVIPAQYIDEIIKEGWTYLLLLLDPVSKKINLIPTHSTEVLKVTFYLSNLTTSSLRAFSDIVLKYKISNLYTGELSFIDKNIFESFIDASKMDEDMICNLSEDFSKIEGVIEVKIEKIACEKEGACK